MKREADRFVKFDAHSSQNPPGLARWDGPGFRRAARRRSFLLFGREEFLTSLEEVRLRNLAPIL